MDQLQLFRRLMLDEAGNRYSDAFALSLLEGGAKTAKHVSYDAPTWACEPAAVHFACARAHAENTKSGRLHAVWSMHHARLAYALLGKPFPGVAAKQVSASSRLMRALGRALLPSLCGITAALLIANWHAIYMYGGLSADAASANFKVACAALVGLYALLPLIYLRLKRG